MKSNGCFVRWNAHTPFSILTLFVAWFLVPGVAHLHAQVAPTITFHPESQKVIEGDGVWLIAGAVGSPPLQYEWLLNGTPIPAATNSSLRLDNVTLTNSGNYRVTVTNDYGSAISSHAMLTVLPKRRATAGWPDLAFLSGHCKRVKVLGDIAYVLLEDGFAIYDVSDPINPSRIGVHRLFSSFERPRNFCIAEPQGVPWIFIATTDGILILDVSTPSAPVRMPFMAMQGIFPPVEVWVEGEDHLVDFSGSTLLVTSVKNRKFNDNSLVLHWLIPPDPSRIWPDHWLLVSTNELSTNASGNALSSGEMTHYSQYIEGFGFLDGPPFIATDTGVFTVDNGVSSFPMTGASSMSVHSSRAFVLNDQTYGLNVIDFTWQPPRLAGSYNGSLQPSAIFVKGPVDFSDPLGIVYLTGYDFASNNYVLRLLSCDVFGSPPTFSRLGQINVADLPEGVDVVSNYVYVASGNYLEIVDAASPTNPATVARLQTVYNIAGIEITGNLAFLADTVAGVHILNVNDPANPNLLCTISTAGGASGVKMVGNRLYVVGDGGFSIFDTTTPGTPVLLGQLPTVGGRMVVSGQTAFLAQGPDIRIVDVSNPSEPLLADTVSVEGFITDINADANLAFLTIVNGASNRVDVFDLTDPLAPARIASHSITGFPQGINVRGSLAFVSKSDRGMEIVDVGNPAAPVTLLNYTNSPVWSAVAVSDNVAIFESDGGPNILDITTPAHPIPIGAYREGISVAKIVGELVFIGSGDGLKIVPLDGLNAQPPAVVHQPVDQAVAPGQTVTFAVDATGSLPLWYQWFLNGAPILNATNAFHTFTAQPTNLGGYSVVVTNTAGAILSDTARLSFDTVPPRIVRHEPAGDVSGTLSYLDVWFSETIKQSTLTASDISVTNPLGQVVLVTNVQPAGFNRFRIQFAPQQEFGQYTAMIGPDIRDSAGNALDAVYVAAANLTGVDLELTNVTLSTNQMSSGELLTISWSGRNVSTLPLLFDWSDAVFLSQNAQWDINDLLLATVPHSGGLVSNETYTAGTTIRIPGVLPGNYHLIVRTDFYNQQKEADGETNNIVSAGPISISVPALVANGNTVTNTLSPNDLVHYYALQVGPGEFLRLRLDGQGTFGFNELHVGLGTVPTRSAGGWHASARSQDQEIVLTAPSGGATYYILIYGDQITNATPYQLVAETSPMILTGITPKLIGNSANGLITVSGAGFDETVAVEFTGTNGDFRVPTLIEAVSPTNMVLNLDLTNWPPNVYSLRVFKATATNHLASAFTVVQGREAKLETRLIVPSAVGFAIPIRQTLWIEYTNSGDHAMPAPLLMLHGDSGARITADESLAIPRAGFGTISGVNDTVQLLGLGSSATPWILQPGEAGRIPIYYIGLSQPASYPQVTFTLNPVTGNDDEVINWAEQEPIIRPVGIDDASWATEFIGIQSLFGATWGSYVETLAEISAQTAQESGEAEGNAASLFILGTLSLQNQPSPQTNSPPPPPPGPFPPDFSTEPLASILIGQLSSPYGSRQFKNSCHDGIDIGYNPLTPLGAVKGGTGWVAQYLGAPESGYGFQVELRNTSRSERFRYAHLDRTTAGIYGLSDPYLQSAALPVAQEGQVIANCGNTGSPGLAYHLHLRLPDGGNPLTKFTYPYRSPGTATRCAGDGALGSTRVNMQLQVEAPSWDLQRVVIQLIEVDGAGGNYDSWTRDRFVDDCLNCQSCPPGIKKRFQYALNSNPPRWNIVEDFKGLPQLSCDPNLSQGWRFKVTAYTYGGQQSETFLTYKPSCKKPPKPPCTGNCTGGNSTTVSSFDPNDKTGPAGFGAARFVRTNATMPYVIRFENKSDATAPARQVVVTDTLDANLDLTTLELTEITIADRIIPIPAGFNHYEARMPFSVTNSFSTNTIMGDIQAALNIQTRTLTLTLSALDTNTGWFPEDPFTGLLYPNDETRRGEGSISYLVRPRSGVPTGTRIENRARIVFDYNDPIDTPLVFNTVDSALPISSVAVLPANVTNSNFMVSWSGTDVGSGLASYDIYVSTNRTSWTRWLENSVATSALFPGQDNRTYHFYSVAVDNVGNFEASPVVADAMTTTPTNDVPSLDPIADQAVDANSVLVVTNRAYDFWLSGQKLNFSLVTAPTGARITSTSSNEARFVWIPTCEQGGTTNLITVQVSDNGNPPLTTTRSFNVIVPDCVQVKLGNTVVRAGDAVAVPMELLSTVQLSNVLMTGTYAVERFTNLSLLISTEQVATVAFFDLPGANMMVLGLNMQTNHALRTSTGVATLGITAFSNQSSAFVWNTLPGVEAYRLDGSMVTNAYGLPGRIVVVGEEPLLEALRAHNNQVALLQYAPTGSTMTIQWNTNAVVGNWQPIFQNTQSNLVQETGNLIPNLPMLFFQAVRGTNGH